jgi:hypothetical protein
MDVTAGSYTLRIFQKIHTTNVLLSVYSLKELSTIEILDKKIKTQLFLISMYLCNVVRF